MSKVNFFFEDVDAFKLNEVIPKWLGKVAKDQNKYINTINYVFCSDVYLLDMNIRYLNHDTYTDILTFDNSDSESHIDADIFISVDRVRENAKGFKEKFETELARVIVHGLLHLSGFNDKGPEAKASMRKAENESLILLGKLVSRETNLPKSKTSKNK